MGVSQWLRVLDTVSGLARLGVGARGGSAEELDRSAAGGGSLEARLAGVVVAALKEAFDRDRARMDLEREQVESERKRAEQALQAELRRQAAERALGQLRLMAIMALGTWMLSAALAVWLPGLRAGLPRLMLGAGWLCALAALGCALAGWQKAAHDTAGAAPRLISASQWSLLGAIALVAGALLAGL
jgi:hypothetical protein